MLSRDEILSALTKEKDYLSENYCVSSIALFGSYSRNEQTEDSDIDILIELHKSTYRNFSGVKNFLESLFQKKIDLVCSNGLNEAIKPYIMKDAKWLVS